MSIWDNPKEMLDILPAEINIFVAASFKNDKDVMCHRLVSPL